MGIKTKVPGPRSGEPGNWDQNWIQYNPDAVLDQQLIEALRAYRTALVGKIAAIEAHHPPTGNELRPFCCVILSIDKLRLDIADMEAA
jgi:hypothetical protein